MDINTPNYIITDTDIKEYVKTIKKIKSTMGPELSHLLNEKNYISTLHCIYINRGKLFTSISEINYTPCGYMMRNGYAFIWIPHFDSDLIYDRNNFIQVYKVIKIINWLYKSNPKGWIIDLRGNTGGIIEFFMVAICQFIDEFELHGVDKHGESNSSIISRNDTFIYTNNHEEIFRMEYPYKSNIKIDNIRILIDENTASAAEFITIILKKFKGAKIYGHDSFGIITVMNDEYVQNVNVIFPISQIIFDGEKIVPDEYGIPDEFLPLNDYNFGV